MDYDIVLCTYRLLYSDIYHRRFDELSGANIVKEEEKKKQAEKKAEEEQKKKGKRNERSSGIEEWASHFQELLGIMRGDGRGRERVTATCYNCGGAGHSAAACTVPKKNK